MMPVTDHVIIVGYGLNGRNLARALKSAGIPYVVLECNGQVVRRAKLEREPIIFGDGTRAEVLDRVGIHRARIVVFVIASLPDERRAVVVARYLNPKVHILTRTRYVAEIEELQHLGADEVVPEEFETSLEIFARVLRRYDVPASRIREAAEDARSRHYELLRERGASPAPMDEMLSRLGARIDLEVVVVREGAEAIGMTAAGLQLRTRTGAVVTGVIRNGEPFFSTGATPQFSDAPITFQPGDEVVIVGDPRAISEATLLFRPLTRAMTAAHPVQREAAAPATE
jgi:CPA2 family monovalent cation:H+ antiporter-2